MHIEPTTEAIVIHFHCFVFTTEVRKVELCQTMQKKKKVPHNKTFWVIVGNLWGKWFSGSGIQSAISPETCVSRSCSKCSEENKPENLMTGKAEGRRFVDCIGLKFHPDAGLLLKEKRNAIKRHFNTRLQNAYKRTNAMGCTAIRTAIMQF